MSQHNGAPKLDISIERWPFKHPVRINNDELTGSSVVVARLTDGAHCGRGEALGVRYHGDTAEKLAARIEAVRAEVESGADREALRKILPAGGARNALDCALWDLEAQRRGLPVWKMAGLTSVRPLVTTFTLGIDTPAAMAEAAIAYRDAKEIKIKLDGDEADRDRLLAIRKARPDAALMIDANQGWSMAHLERMLPDLVACRVILIEQPLPVGGDAELEGFNSPIPIAADESVQDSADLEQAARRYRAVNIKLDKTGGLTEALALAATARRMGLSLMVGCMGGTSLSIAPHFIVGQLCERVDLDGPVFLRRDRDIAATYAEGTISCPPALWGYPTKA